MFNFLHIKTVPHRHGESTGWLGLFFDLIYVAILVELGDRLSHNLSLEGVIQFALLFIPVWWSWLALVLYNRRFPTDDIGQRLLIVIYMAVMGLMAFNIHDVTGSTATYFVLAYALSKVVLVAMYAKAWHQFPEYRTSSATLMVGFAIAAVLWLAIGLFAPTNYMLWGVVIAFTVLAPFFVPLLRSLTKRQAKRPPIKTQYMVDRFGELTIIVLGEFFIKVITSASDREVFPVTLLYFVLLLGVATSLWWLYFDHQEHSTLANVRSRRQIWVYIHYPLLAAITAYGVVGKKVMALAPGEALSDPKRWILCSALAVAILSTGVIEWAAREQSGEAMSRRPQGRLRVVGALLLVALAIWGGGLSAPLLITIVAAILVGLVGLDVTWRLRNPARGKEEGNGQSHPTQELGTVGES